MPGSRSPFGLSRLAELAQQITSATVQEALPASRCNVSFPQVEGFVDVAASIQLVDLEIQFIGARDLPRTDVVGLCDPYFVAQIDQKISYVSIVQPDTLSPSWDELWRVKNVPATADLTIELLDKDEGSPHDDYIGKCMTSVSLPGSSLSEMRATTRLEELQIYHPAFTQPNGVLQLKITSTPSASSNPRQKQDIRSSTRLYLFDGPIRFSCHFSRSVGHLVPRLNDSGLYCTYKIFLRGVPLFFGNSYQHWNRQHKNAQRIFRRGSTMSRGIQMGHRMLYARTVRDQNGQLQCGKDLLHILRGGAELSSKRRGSDCTESGDDESGEGENLRESGKRRGVSGESWLGIGFWRSYSPSSGDTAQPRSCPFAGRIKPAVYTYIISAQDDSFRFSETGAAFFLDFASKHAQHSNCAPTVRYSGEFHPRPVGGWERFLEAPEDSDKLWDDEMEWELVFDNNSGTYAPDENMLGPLRALLEYNFPGLRILTLDRESEALASSRKACVDYCEKRAMMEGTRV